MSKQETNTSLTTIPKGFEGPANLLNQLHQIVPAGKDEATFSLPENYELGTHVVTSKGTSEMNELELLLFQSYGETSTKVTTTAYQAQNIITSNLEEFRLQSSAKLYAAKDLEELVTLFAQWYNYLKTADEIQGTDGVVKKYNLQFGDLLDIQSAPVLVGLVYYYTRHRAEGKREIDNFDQIYYNVIRPTFDTEMYENLLESSMGMSVAYEARMKEKDTLEFSLPPKESILSDAGENWKFMEDDLCFNVPKVTDTGAEILITSATIEEVPADTYTIYYSTEALSSNNLEGVKNTTVSGRRIGENGERTYLKINDLKPNTKYYIAVAPVHTSDQTQTPPLLTSGGRTIETQVTYDLDEKVRKAVVGDLIQSWILSITRDEDQPYQDFLEALQNTLPEFESIETYLEQYRTQRSNSVNSSSTTAGRDENTVGYDNKDAVEKIEGSSDADGDVVDSTDMSGQSLDDADPDDANQGVEVEENKSNSFNYGEAIKGERERDVFKTLLENLKLHGFTSIEDLLEELDRTTSVAIAKTAANTHKNFEAAGDTDGDKASSGKKKKKKKKR